MEDSNSMPAGAEPLSSATVAQFLQFSNLISELRDIWAKDGDFSASLECICRWGRQILRADGACAFAVDREEVEAVCQSADETDDLPRHRFALDDSAQFPVRVIRSGSAQTERSRNRGLFPPGWVLGEPIEGDSRIVGALVFYRKDPKREFAAAEQAQATVLARQAAFSYRMRRRSRELQLVYEVTRAINSSLRLEEVLEFIYQGISRILPTDNFYIALYDAPSEEIRFEIEIEDRQRLPRRSRASAAGLTEFLLETRSPLLINRDFSATCERLGIRFGGRPARCWMGAPMVFRDKAVGVIALQSYDQEGLFDREHLSVLENVAGQAAVAIENARLYQQTVQSYDQLHTTQQLLLQSEKLAAVGQLISGIAHELNNPLTGVVGWTQYLMAQPAGEAVKRHLSTINEQAQRAARIVQNLLTFSRQHKPEQNLVGITDIVESTLALRAYELRVNNIAVVRRYAADLPPVAADPHQLQQVILNLIINAEQAILSVRRSGAITVSSEQAGDSVRLIVCDDGPGIPPDKLKKVFDPFFTTKPIGQGTGLGLSISFGILQEHRGKIWAENIPNSGARFILELPLPQSTPAALPADGATAAPAVCHERKVLIVDDEEIVRDLLTAVLEDDPILIETAANGEEALLKARSTNFDLIITDLKMPGLSGAQFCEKLRQAHPARPTQFLFMTGDVLAPETQQFLESTRSRCMLKPFDILRAREMVLKALAQPGASAGAGA